MKECFCSIFDTREERIIEEDGRVFRRLICNICGCVLDSKLESENEALGQERRISGEMGGETFSC